MRGLRLAMSSTLLAALLSALPQSALAHGALSQFDRACLLKIGPDFLYFSGYQPSLTRRKFCEDVPTASEAIFSFDYAQSELREMSSDFRIVRDLGQNEEAPDLQAITLAYLPPKVYPSGTLTFKYDFKERGDFVGIVTLVGPHGEHWTARFPFSVGRILPMRTSFYLLTGAAAFALLMLLWGRKDVEQ